jgi:uncharacterized repeat protein (TIGR01451 family)
MKKALFFAIIGLFILNKTCQAQVVPDTALANIIYNTCPTCIDMSTQNLTPFATNIDSLTIGINPYVHNFEGLQYFIGLTKFKMQIPFYDLLVSNNYLYPNFYLPPNITHLAIKDNVTPSSAGYVNSIQLNLPNTITHLDLRGFGLASLNLPSNLEFLKLSWMDGCITQYPNTLKEMVLAEYLNCMVNQIEIPPSVERLTLIENTATLPPSNQFNNNIYSTNSNLRYLKYEISSSSTEYYHIDYNSFPNLDSLIAINLHPTFIDGLPQNLKYLKMSNVYNFNNNLINNQLDLLKTLILINTGDPDVMPQLANNIDSIYFYHDYCNDVPFVFNSSLPDSLKYLTLITDPTSNICFPTLPQGLLQLKSSFKNNNMGTNFTACIPNQPPQLQVTYQNTTIFPPICPSNLPNCYDFQLPSVSGKCYLDLNGDSIFSGFGEPLLSYPIKKEEVSTGAISYIYPNINNYNTFYDFIDTSSTYIYEVVNSNPYYTAPAPDTIISNNQSAQFFDLNLAVTPNQSIDDVEMWYANAWDFSPGTINYISTLVRNNGTNIANGTININFDPLLSIYNSNGGIVNVNTLSFPINNLASGAILHYNFQTYLNTLAQFGDTVELTFNASIVGNDIDTTNNNYIINSPVLAAYDPNDINVDKTILSSTNVQQDAFLTYTIRFQNTGNAPAQNVYLTDSLSNYLDPSYFEVVYSEHPNYLIQFLNTNDPTKPYVLKVIYNNIYLPDSNANEPASHGKFVFKIKVRNNTGLGSIIPASAAIYFDYSPAVITNMVTTLIMDPTKTNYNSQMNFTSHLAPNPANESVQLMIRSESNCMIKLNFFSNSGQLIKSQEKQVVKGQNLLEQSLLNLSPGFYLLKISDAEGKNIGIHKLVKQ